MNFAVKFKNMTAGNAAKKTHWATIIVGGGQAGLVTGYYLQSLKQEFIILDANENIGDAWRNRWDSLTLFTPNWANNLAGYKFPGASNNHPGKDSMANYLYDYAKYHALPVQTGTRVTLLEKELAGGYRLTTNKGIFTCINVVVANGSFAKPKLPHFAGRIDPSITQIHSSQYKRPAHIPDGEVLVVGAGTSGIQIAIDIASAGKRVYLSGNPPPKIPGFILKYFGKQFVWIAQNILTINTPPGRKLANKFKVKGMAAPLINVCLQDAINAGAVHVQRVKTAVMGLPVLEDNKKLNVKTIVWCTGYTNDFSWIQLDGVQDANGFPSGYRGISASHPGLYFMGMVFQYSLSSVSINGMSRDAEYIARHIHKSKSS